MVFRNHIFLFCEKHFCEVDSVWNQQTRYTLTNLFFTKQINVKEKSKPHKDTVISPSPYMTLIKLIIKLLRNFWNNVKITSGFDATKVAISAKRFIYHYKSPLKDLSRSDIFVCSSCGIVCIFNRKTIKNARI
jgi:hypothetical protein